MIAGVILGAGAGNRLSGRLGARVAIPIGLLVTAGGLVLFSRAGADTTYGLVATALAIIGIGIGTGLPTSLDVILGVLPGSQTGAGTALTRALQQVAASFGVAILGSLLNSVYQAHLTPRIAGLPAAAQSIAQGSLAGAVAIAARLPAGLGRPIASAAKDAYSSGMTEVMLVSATIMAATAIGIALFLPSKISKIDEAPLP
jgi:MFS transporter, DHA2 family, multidrug resistance protein